MHIMWTDFQGAKNVRNKEAHSEQVWEDSIQIQVWSCAATHKHLGRDKDNVFHTRRLVV